MKLLLFESKKLSYDSSWCFMEMLRRGFERQGAEVIVFSLENLEQQEEELLALCQEKFDAVFDTNSALASVKIDKERYYMDSFKAPFYHFIVDHPLHVHHTLNVPLKDYHVICLDSYHKAYIEKYYPRIKEVLVMPFAGIASGEFGAKEVCPMNERKISLLFPGTYTPLEYYRQQMEARGEHYWELTQEILTEYQQGSHKPIHQLFLEKTHSEEFFPMKLHKARYVEKYIREWYRQQILDAILAQDVIVDVVGFRWEMYEGKGKNNLRLHSPRSYGQQLELLSQSKMVLNVQPLFMDGVHDRVMNAMMNHSVALTDSCEFLNQNFIPEKEYIVFDKNEPETIASWIRKNGRNHEKLEEIEKQAYQKVSANHSWYKRAEMLLERIRN